MSHLVLCSLVVEQKQERCKQKRLKVEEEKGKSSTSAYSPPFKS